MTVKDSRCLVEEGKVLQAAGGELNKGGMVGVSYTPWDASWADWLIFAVCFSGLEGVDSLHIGNANISKQRETFSCQSGDY